VLRVRTEGFAERRHRLNSALSEEALHPPGSRQSDRTCIDEVILDVAVGLKPHAQVEDEIARYVAELAPAFAEQS
jgi:hypothetical protein